LILPVAARVRIVWPGFAAIHSAAMVALRLFQLLLELGEAFALELPPR